MSNLRDKWDRHYREQDGGTPSPARVLREHGYLLPTDGAALDLACGRGGNALFLAARGLRTSGWDIAPQAVAQLRRQAEAQGLAVTACVRDVEADPPATGSFDVIAVSHYLWRPLCPQIAAALRPGGLLFYQTFVREKVTGKGPRNPDYLLARNELLSLFAGLEIVVYRDEGRIGDLQQGLRNESLLVARAPAPGDGAVR